MLTKSLSILELMVKDHNKIQDLLDKLEEETKNDFESMEKSFEKFEWELEKHIFTEEKAIFTSYTPDDVIEGYKMLPELTKQHNYIINRLNNWKEDIRKKRMLSDFNSFKIFLTRHKDFEEERVYPNLDQSLTEKEKKHIIVKINEITQK